LKQEFPEPRLHLFLTLTKCSWMVSFTHRLPYATYNSRNRILCGPQSRCERCAEEEYFISLPGIESRLSSLYPINVLSVLWRNALLVNIRSMKQCIGAVSGRMRAKRAQLRTAYRLHATSVILRHNSWTACKHALTLSSCHCVSFSDATRCGLASCVWSFLVRISVSLTLVSVYYQNSHIWTPL
jgi:hypothetical protein